METVLPNDDLICLSIPYFSKIGVTPLYNLTIDDLPGAINLIYSLISEYKLGSSKYIFENESSKTSLNLDVVLLISPKIFVG